MFIFSLFSCITSQKVLDQDFEKQMTINTETVRNYLFEQEYSEVFDDIQHKVRIEDVEMIDLDHDVHNEMILLINPYYRQSPTIVLFQISQDYGVRRIKEGLAPGPLVPVTGNYIDPHTLGGSVDFTIEDDDNKHGSTETNLKDKSIIEMVLDSKGHIVEYKNFFHMDTRDGLGGYIDMSHQEEFADEESCESFEFSFVDEIYSGYMGDQKHNFLITVVKDSIYIYQIDKIFENGLIKKKMWITPKPAEFKRFIKNSPGPIVYQTTEGEIINFTLP